MNFASSPCTRWLWNPQATRCSPPRWCMKPGCGWEATSSQTLKTAPIFSEPRRRPCDVFSSNTHAARTPKNAGRAPSASIWMTWTWPQKPLRAVFNEAVEIKDPAERAAYLDQACGQDAVLRRKIDDLLRAHEEAGGFLGEQEGGAATLPITEKAGDRIGRYKLVEKIGEGGCGIVYLAEQEEPLRRRVALKVIRLGMDTQSVIA